MRKWIVLAIAFILMGAACALAAQSLPDDSESRTDSASLPVLSIVLDTGELPGDEMLYGQMTLYENGRSRTERIGLRLRGNTSRRFPKKSYRLIILDEAGEKKDLSIAGLRSDDDWILNPLYTDSSKIREALAYEVWDAINSSGQRAQSSRLKHAEVYLNGEYWGLYGVQERIDRKQVDADKRSGILYKVARLDIPTVADVLDCADAEICAGIELEFAGAGVSQPWEPAAGYMAIYHGEANPFSARIDAKNLIDYGLWMMFVQAHDCHFKNQFIHAVYEQDGYTMYKIPWDLNNTFGDVWENDSPETNHTEYRIVDFMLDGIFEWLVFSEEEAGKQAIVQRWQQLRATVLREEPLIARAHALYDPLYEALERDSLRWPEGGMGSGNAHNISDIEDYIRQTLTELDAWMETL